MFANKSFSESTFLVASLMTFKLSHFLTVGLLGSWFATLLWPRELYSYILIWAGQGQNLYTEKPGNRADSQLIFWPHKIPVKKRKQNLFRKSSSALSYACQSKDSVLIISFPSQQHLTLFQTWSPTKLPCLPAALDHSEIYIQLNLLYLCENFNTFWWFKGQQSLFFPDFSVPNHWV